MADLIQRDDSLNTGREKLNEAIKASDRAEGKSDNAVDTANQALSNSESTQTQLDTIVIDGDSSVEAAQARVDEKGEAHPTLKARIDDGMNSVNQQLAEIETEVSNLGENKIDKAQAATKEELTQGLDNKITYGNVKRQDLDDSSDSNKWDINDFNESSRQAILESNDIDINYVLGENSVTETNLANKSVSSSKRTRLGELATIMIGNTGIIPNIITTDRLIVFPSTFFIVSGKNRYSITGGKTLDYSSVLGSTTGIVIYYDTNEKEFVIESQTELATISEDCILFATLSFATGNVLIHVNMNCRFTINGIDSEVYFLNRLPEKLIDSIPKKDIAVVSIAAAGNMPDYNTSTRELTFDNSFFIYHGDKRYSVNQRSIDFSSILNTNRSAIAYFNTNNSDFIVRPTNDLTGLPNSAILFAIVYNNSDGSLKSIFLTSEYTINGNPKYMPYYENGDNQEYQFTSETLTGSVSPSDFEGIGDSGSPFDYTNDKHTLVYNLFDDLMVGDYTAKSEIGRSTNNLPIYEYAFNPFRSTFTGLKPYPKILLNGAIHGGEGLAVVTLYYLMKRIVEEWQEDERLNYLRSYINFSIVPLKNPEAYNEKDYNGPSGVNINRNFDFKWNEADSPKGSAPFSEMESQVQRDYLQQHKDALFNVDLHVRGNRRVVSDSQMMWLSCSTEEQARIATKTIEDMSKKWKMKHPSLPDLQGYITRMDSPGTYRSYSHNVVGINTVTWEGFSASTTLNDAENKEIVNMNVDYLIEFILNVCKFYQNR